MCHQVLTNGACSRGPRCNFAHKSDELRNNLAVSRPKQLSGSIDLSMAQLVDSFPPYNFIIGSPPIIPSGPTPINQTPPNVQNPVIASPSYGVDYDQQGNKSPCTIAAPPPQPPSVPTVIGSPIKYIPPAGPIYMFSGGNSQNCNAQIPLFQPESHPQFQAHFGPAAATAFMQTTPMSQMLPSSPPTAFHHHHAQFATALPIPVTGPAAGTMIIQPTFGSPPIYSIFHQGNWTPLSGTSPPSSMNGFSYYGFDVTSSMKNQQQHQQMNGFHPEDHLLLKRNEIKSHMKSIVTKNNDESEEEIDHVSHTVATSVLREIDKDISIGSLEFPPLSMGKLSAINLSKPSRTSASFAEVSSKSTFATHRVSTNSGVISTHSSSRDKISNISTVATVQSDHTVMQIVECMERPRVASTIQKPAQDPGSSGCIDDTAKLATQLPTVIKPLNLMPSENPQDFFTSTFDQIVSLKEKISGLEKDGDSSTVEKDQLKLEVDILNRKISLVDEHTKEICLTKELKSVEKEIDQLKIVTSH